LTQVAAAKAAINKVGGMLLKSHAMGCVKGAVLSDDKEKSSEMIDELVDVVLKFMK
jgi:DNA-binding FrmR family transcriptional regulator